MTNLFLAATIGLLGSADPQSADEAKKNGWHTDYAQALAEAKQRGRLLFVVFR